MFETQVPNELNEVKSSSRRQGIMLCYPFEEKRLKRWKPPYIIQPKLDGVRCRAVYVNGTVTLISSEGHIIEYVPHINDALIDMMADTNKPTEFDGELYVHGMHFQDIISRTSRKTNAHPDAEKIEYHMFDIVNMKMQIDRIAELNHHGFYINNPAIKVVESSLAKDFSEVMDFYNRYIDSGYEGFVIRDIYGEYSRKRYTGMMKFKPHQSDEYPIVGTQEEVSIDGVPKGTLGAFVCISDGILFSVGTGLTQDQRIDLWKERESLIGKKLKVKYQSLTQGKGVPRFPVALEVIGGR